MNGGETAVSSDATVRFDADGLVPVVAQEATTGDVLMVAFMNEAALAATRATGRAHYWSRGRGRLWRKGETSGHEQVVEAIAVNCERTSLLLTVRQIGAVCHDGYPTCFYRQLQPDEGLAIVRERTFDPATVYGGPGVSNRSAESGVTGPPLPDRLRLLFGAYAFLRDHDLTGASATSRRLRSETEAVAPRVADELAELAGVLDGSHRHLAPCEDAILEAGQVFYWVLLAALRSGITWEELRPDRVLSSHVSTLDAGTAARVLRAEARRWQAGPVPEPTGDTAARCHAALALVGHSCAVAGVAVADLVERDLAQLREKEYLADYFTGVTPLDRSGRR